MRRNVIVGSMGCLACHRIGTILNFHQPVVLGMFIQKGYTFGLIFGILGVRNGGLKVLLYILDIWVLILMTINFFFF